MKHTITFLVALLISSITFAQQGINYKAVVKDDLGNILGDQEVDIKFSIIEDTGATVVYLEDHSDVMTDPNGIIILTIGEGASTDVFNDIDWGNDAHSLKVEIDLENDAVFEDLGTTQFKAVPYALQAASLTNGAIKLDDLIDAKSDTDDGSSLFIGVSAGINDDGTSNNNIGIGNGALFSNTIGNSNTATGKDALYSNTEGNYNTANGTNALYFNTTGINNTANGLNTLYSNTTGSNNTANGVSALFANLTGNFNTATGREALNSNTTGNNNTANGVSALRSNTTGNNNTANGANALRLNTTGNNNTANGISALYANLTGNNNTAAGQEALNSNTIGSENTATGKDALHSNTEGNYNTANGARSLYFNTTGNNNTANGFNTLYSNITGSNNTANGLNALFSNTTGNNNTANGIDALNSNTIGSENTATGKDALRTNSEGNYNTANGARSLYFNTTGNNNTANGFNTLYSNITGSNNTANGLNALFSNTTGNNNTANGIDALKFNTEGNSNTANGGYALYNNTTGSNNTANGISALYANLTGNNNTATGREALNSNTIGNENTATGKDALRSNMEGGNNTANGFNAMYSNTAGNYNTANGESALYANQTGNNNTATGNKALNSNTTGNNNTANGIDALKYNTIGYSNTANGGYALYSNIDGNQNVSIGVYSGFNVTGNDNVFVGFEAGKGTGAHGKSGSVFIGNQAGANEENSNRLYIENSSSENPLVYGEFDTDLLRINGTLDINDAYQLPLTDGTANQTLKTDGLGNLTWQNSEISTGLEAIDQGNGIGWRLKGRNPLQYQTIGNQAIDFSIVSPVDPPDLPNLGGAHGPGSLAVGINTLAVGQGSFAAGRGTHAESIYSSTFGVFNLGQGDSQNFFLTDPIFEIGNGTSDSNRNNAVTVLKNGNFGIGRATPTSLLEVGHLNGAPTSSDRTNAFSIRNLGTGRSWQMYTESNGYLLLFNDGNYRGSFNATSGAYVQASDRRVKKDIVPLDSETLDKVMHLNPVSYLMKDQTDSKRNLGLISQEVQEIFPSITHYSKESDLLTLSYTELIPILIKAIQEQQDIIEAQTSENAQQSEAIQNLMQRVERIEASNNK